VEREGLSNWWILYAKHSQKLQ